MKTLRTIGLSLEIFLCFSLTGCWTDINPADPSGEPGPPVLVASRASYLTVPVTVQLKDVQSLLNTQVPTHVEGTHHIIVPNPIPHCEVHWRGFHSTVTCTHDTMEVAHIDWHADRGQIQLTGASDKISVSSSFSGGGKLIPSAATAEANGTANGSSTLTVGSDYNLTPSVDLNVNIDHAAVLHEVSVKGLVQDAVNDQISKTKVTIGATISQQVDLRESMPLICLDWYTRLRCCSRNKRCLDNDQSSGCDVGGTPRNGWCSHSRAGSKDRSENVFSGR